MKGFLQEIHPVLPVKDVKEALKFYVHKMGFKIAFADDDTNPFYAGIKRDAIEIHLQWHDSPKSGLLLKGRSFVFYPKILKVYSKSIKLKLFFIKILL